MSASWPDGTFGSGCCEMLETQGGVALEQLGSRPMKPGLPVGSFAARAGAPEAVVNR
jgi:hypothetical protein